jgi:hypothetical protein
VLTGLCLVIALPGRASVGVRLAGSLTLSIVAYVVGILVLLVGIGSNEVSANEWRTVTSPEGQFSVALPGVTIQHPHGGPNLDGAPCRANVTRAPQPASTPSSASMP